MFNSLPHGDFGKPDEVNLAKGLRVLIPHPDKGIRLHVDSDAAINSDQCPRPDIRIYAHPDNGLSVSGCLVCARMYGVTWLSSIFVSFRP